MDEMRPETGAPEEEIRTTPEENTEEVPASAEDTPVEMVPAVPDAAAPAAEETAAAPDSSEPAAEETAAAPENSEPAAEETATTPDAVPGEAPAPGKKKIYQQPLLWITIVAIAAVVIWYCTSHVYVAGNSIAKTASDVDLRDQEITAEEYAALTEKLPDTEIYWNVPLSTGRQDSHAESLTLSALTPEDLELLALFPELRRVDFTEDFTDYPQALALADKLPAVDAFWTVELGGKRWDNGTRELTLDTASVTPEDLTEALAFLPAAEVVTFTGAPADFERLDAVSAVRPGLRTVADLELCGTVFSSEAETLSFAGREDLTAEDAAFITDNAFRFPALTTLDFTGCGLEDETLVDMAAALGKDVVWNTKVYGIPVCSTDSQIDVSYLRIRDNGEQIEKLLPGMHHLKKVLMLECGISDEDMDALNNRHDDVRFVWMVHFGGYTMRSDETAFIAAKWERGYLFNDTVAPIKYCTDLVALDLGHQKFTDISFLYSMPHLRFLILADGFVSDITPIATLQELEYLELFKSPVEDLTPLLECKNLKDLNICYIPLSTGDNAYKVLMQTTWLERLFYFGNPWSQQQRDAIRDAYPETSEVVLYNGLESTGLDWRYHERYYEMRDLLDIYYMPGGTNGEDDG